MKKIPFKVSARAARLIGRENVATSQGAITELVKNAYDADASSCVILFVRRHKTIPQKLTALEFLKFSEVSGDSKFATQQLFYTEIDGGWELRSDIGDEGRQELDNLLEDIVDLWILDDGRGMSSEIIEEQWMVIGTDVKERDSTSSGGRALTGAKGIGRFALDRLGKESELFSAEEMSADVLHWMVDWGDFEGSGKVIDDVTAILDVEKRSFLEAILDQDFGVPLPSRRPIRDNLLEDVSFEHGTAIGISHLHDIWDLRDSQKLKESLEALLPPKDRGDFGIFLFDHRNEADGGWIENFGPDDTDYRLHAVIKSDGTVNIGIDRNEIVFSNIRPSVFTLDAMKEPGFSKADLMAGHHSYETDLSKIVSLEKWESKDDLEALGPFEFTLYFLKKSNPTAKNLKRYPLKSFALRKRRDWLANSGGIRLYRDEFRVRPYGEPNSQSSDWLLLGQRASQNPAAVSRLDWRVGAQQVAGTIHISKSANPLLADQSNREGIMNERSFALFRRVIVGLISEFERDRSYLFHQFSTAYDIDNPDVDKLDTGKKIADKILKNKDENDEEPQADLDLDESPSPNQSVSSNSIAVAEALDISVRENVILKDEIQVLRGMATLGTVLVSFTHELKQIKANMGSRQTRMENALDRVVDTEKLEVLAKPLSPYELLARWGREDEKVGRWVDFALSSVSPTKRRKRPIGWGSYLTDLKGYWSEFLKDRNIELSIPIGLPDDLKVLAHEIDLDSIFYNLIINSFEAFSVPSEAQSRNISIELQHTGEIVEVVYRDNGPGIADVFNVVNDVFIYGSTSKREAKHNDVTGTGIGMWLAKSIVDDYDGDVIIVSKMGQPGFALKVTLPRYRPPESP